MSILSEIPNDPFETFINNNGNININVKNDNDISYTEIINEIPTKKIINQTLRLLNLNSFKSKIISLINNYTKFKIGSHLNSDNRIQSDNKNNIQLGENRTKAKLLLEKSASMGNVDSLFLLGEINLYGNYSYPTNYPLSLYYYKQLTHLSPNSTAYYILGFMYSTGLFGSIPQSQSKANLYYQLSSDLGNLKAKMALGYRYFNGIATESDCGISLNYYSQAANLGYEYLLSGPADGLHLSNFGFRISDANGGIFGANSGEMINTFNTFLKDLKTDASDVELLIETKPELSNEFYKYKKSSLFYSGIKFKARNYELAYKYAKECASTIWPTEDEDQEHDQPKGFSDVQVYSSVKCAGILGMLYLRGDGSIPQNFPLAKKWFERSNSYSNRVTDIVTLNGLGIMHEYGYEYDLDYDKAMSYYRKAISIDLAGGDYLAKEQKYLAMKNLGKLDYLSGDIKAAFEHLSKSAYNGNIEALFCLAQLYENRENGKIECEYTVTLYKTFVEKLEPFTSSLEWSFNQFLNGNNNLALIGYSMAAEQGFEIAQSSAASILYPISSMLLPKPEISEEKKRAALNYFTRSSKNLNVDSLVVMGDFYFNGIGTEKDYEKAAMCYQTAADLEHMSSIARWNMGWMYENGLGVLRDFHLSKRYYDAALERNPKASFAVNLSLLRLRLKAIWNKLTGGKEITLTEDENIIRSWKDYLLLAKSIFTSTFMEEDTNTKDKNNEVSSIELSIVLFFLACFVIFSIFIYRAQRMRQRNGPPNQQQLQGNFRVNFFFFPI